MRLTAEGVDVVVIQPTIEETNQKVVEQGQDPRRTEGIVCANVSHDGDLRRQWHVGAGCEVRCGARD
jgi:hypothetical protein